MQQRQSIRVIIVSTIEMLMNSQEESKNRRQVLMLHDTEGYILQCADQ